LWKAGHGGLRLATAFISGLNDRTGIETLAISLLGSYG
jgi:hypothetical protein